MYRITLNSFIFVFFFSTASFAQNVYPNENGGDPEVQKTIEVQVDLIRKEKKFDEQYKKLVALIDMTNKEFNNYSNIVTDLKSKILENNGDTDAKTIAEKDKNELIYNSWATYKVALEPNYALFIEKNDKYHCDVISQEIWQDYAPTAPSEEKVELDPYTKKAVQISVNLAQLLCNNMSHATARTK